MTIYQALKKYPSVEIDLLLSHVLGKRREFLYMNGGHGLTRRETDGLTRMVTRRLAGEPLAYILGYKDFCGLRFKVDRNVLIPRPETEWLVKRAAEPLLLFKEEYPRLGGGEVVGAIKLSSNPSVPLRGTPSLKKGRRLRGYPIKILDLGTGSGCIAISLAKKLSIFNFQFSITASDVSPTALKVAQQNAKKHRVKIKFVKSGLFTNIKGDFDFIVGNLPYVPLKILHRFLLHKTNVEPIDPFAALKYEPKFALTDGSSSWQIYKRFFEQVSGHIKPGGLILLYSSKIF